MKLAKTNKEEIGRLYGLLNEIEWLHQELRRKDLKDVDWENFEVLDKLGLVKELGVDHEHTAESFLQGLVAELSGIHFQRILTNLECLLDNCADPDKSTLDYNFSIKKGLDLLREWTNAEPRRRKDFPVERVKHAELERVGNSAHTSQCPYCDPGTLVMRRDPETHKLLVEDACLHCAQRVVYEDVKDGVIVELES